MNSEVIEDSQGAYQVVSFRPTWSSLSLLFILFQLPMPYLVTAQPWRPDPLWLWPLVRPASYLVLSILGFVCGLLGLRFSANRSAARIGTLLNGVVLGLMALWVVGMYYIIQGRR
jgi:hypothetical protein